MIERISAEISHDPPAQGLEDAVKAFIETCDVQLDWNFEKTSVGGLDTTTCNPSCRGSTLALSGEGGTWILIALSDRISAQNLTRVLFAFEEDEEVTLEDTADALNEVINVAAGVFKKYRDESGERLTIGLPTYLDGEEATSFLNESMKDMSQTIRTQDGINMKIIAFWQEGAKP